MRRDPRQIAESNLTSHALRLTNNASLHLRLHGAAHQPTLIHLPGLHGDWTLLGPFRAALAERARLVECAYPRREDWSLENYAREIEGALAAVGITSGWMLGESFSSQVGWELLARSQRPGRENGTEFAPSGLILVGGFVRHPWPWGVRVAHTASRTVPLPLLRLLCTLYTRAARRHFGRCSDLGAELDQFVERRVNQLDRRAITRRYRLIAANDPRPIAREVIQPVYQLSGAWDPIVPWWQVRSWLRRHCPGYRTSRIIWSGGHNVLLSAPEKCADQILTWLGENTREGSYSKS